jgi:type VI secretion system Hcp family effector
LTTVLLEFVRATVEGNEEVFHTIKLTNAIVAQVLQSVPNDVTTNLGLERIRFTFQKIEIENKDGNTKFSDNWATNRA